MEERFDRIIEPITETIKQHLRRIPEDIKRQTQEIRLRTGRPVCLYCNKGIYFFSRAGRILCYPAEEMLTATRDDILETFRAICSYSVYSHQDEIRNGYITLRGGHRVGVGGTAVLQDGRIASLRDISSAEFQNCPPNTGMRTGAFTADEGQMGARAAHCRRARYRQGQPCCGTLPGSSAVGEAVLSVRLPWSTNGVSWPAHASAYRRTTWACAAMF